MAIYEAKLKIKKINLFFEDYFQDACRLINILTNVASKFLIYKFKPLTTHWRQTWLMRLVPVTSVSHTWPLLFWSRLKEQSRLNTNPVIRNMHDISMWNTMPIFKLDNKRNRGKCDEGLRSRLYAEFDEDQQAAARVELHPSISFCNCDSDQTA